MITENYIWALLTGDHNWAQIIHRLEWLGRAKAPGLEGHHVEPEREMVVWLKPLEHLAIHIAHARLSPTGSYHAKVAAFVKPYPGGSGYHRVADVSDELREAILSFGQRRPDTVRASIAHALSFIDRDAQRDWMRQLGLARKGVKVSDESRQLVSTANKTKPTVKCEHCGKLIKNIGGNMKQHQRSSKCLKS